MSSKINIFCLIFILALSSRAKAWSQADIAPESRYLVIRDCLHPCFVVFRSSLVSGENYTAQITSYQEYLSHENDLWSMASYFGSVGRVKNFDVPVDSLPVQVPSGKLAVVFTCPGKENCSVQYELESGESWLDSVRRENLPFYALLSFVFLSGTLLCGFFALAGYIFVWIFSTVLLRKKNEEEREMKEYIRL